MQRIQEALLQQRLVAAAAAAAPNVAALHPLSLLLNSSIHFATDSVNSEHFQASSGWTPSAVRKTSHARRIELFMKHDIDKRAMRPCRRSPFHRLLGMKCRHDAYKLGIRRSNAWYGCRRRLIWLRTGGKHEQARPSVPLAAARGSRLRLDGTASGGCIVRSIDWWLLLGLGSCLHRAPHDGRSCVARWLGSRGPVEGTLKVKSASH